MRTTFAILFVLCCANVCFSQAGSYFDPAQSYNKMLLEKGNSFMIIGNYKVKGIPYLYGGAIKGKIFLHEQAASETFLSYDLYTQKVFYSKTASTDPQSLLIPEGKIDSFILYSDNDLQISGNLTFISGVCLGATDSSFYQQVFKGPVSSLYKKYTADLEIVSTNYIESNLRQFGINYQYYYLNESSKELLKIKASYRNLQKQFKIDIGSVVSQSDFTYNPEKSLQIVFEKLLQQNN